MRTVWVLGSAGFGMGRRTDDSYIIDFLPIQVPKDCGGQFFKVENYLLNNYECYGLRDKYIRIILKLMCYYRVSVHWGDCIEQYLIPNEK